MIRDSSGRGGGAAELREVAPRHHDGDLGPRWPSQIDHVPLDRPGDVAVPALDHVERDRHPAAIQRRRWFSCGRGRRRRAPLDLVGPERERVAHRPQGRPVEPVDQDDARVRPAGQPDAAGSPCSSSDRGGTSGGRGMVADERHADVLVGERARGRAAHPSRAPRAARARPIVRGPGTITVTSARRERRRRTRRGVRPRRPRRERPERHVDPEPYLAHAPPGASVLHRVVLDVDRERRSRGSSSRTGGRASSCGRGRRRAGRRSGGRAGSCSNACELLVELAVLALVLVVHPDQEPAPCTGTNTITAQAPCANFVIAITTVTTAVVTAPSTVDREAVPPAGLAEPEVTLGHPGLRQRERGEHADRVERDQRVDVGLEQITTSTVDGDRETDDPVREDQAVPALGQLARHEVVVRVEVRQPREVGERRCSRRGSGSAWWRSGASGTAPFRRRRCRRPPCRPRRSRSSCVEVGRPVQLQREEREPEEHRRRGGCPSTSASSGRSAIREA